MSSPLSAGDFEAGVLKGLDAAAGGMTLLAAVSGGADSVAMLVALSRLRGTLGFGLRVAHVEHGIRPAGESRGDARAVEDLCAGLGLPCRVLTIPRGAVARYALCRGAGVEAAARRFRYRLLRNEAARGGAGAIVTAHTGDDALELALMRLLRGSGPAGLRRMPRRRDFPGLPGGPGGIVILRPLLSLSRADVEAYLTGQGIPWRNDTTNTDERFLRNRIRRGLVPLLNEKFPGWKGGLRALGDTQALAADFIEAEARRRLVWTWADRAGGGRELRCPADLFWAEAPILREEALFRGLGMFGGRGRAPALKRRTLRRFASGELKNLDLGFCVLALGGTPPRVTIFRKKPAFEAGFSLLIKEPGVYKLGYGDDYKSDIGETAFLRVSGQGEFLSAGGGFFAALPFALRPARREDVIPRGAGPGAVYAVQDAAGVAAIIARYHGGAVILRRREFRSGGELFFCDIGGIDV
jgi:tRNA(Ile)-lysidine synthase